MMEGLIKQGGEAHINEIHGTIEIRVIQQHISKFLLLAHGLHVAHIALKLLS